MKPNLLNKNLIIYKIKNFNLTDPFLLIITVNLGWLLFPLKQNKNNSLEPILFGYNRLYKFFFKLKGFGYKWKYLIMLKKLKETFFFKIGFTHKVALIIRKNFKLKLKKRRLIIRSRSYNFIRNQFDLFFFLYQTYLYNKKGIFLRGTQFKLKISKKKSKF